MMQVNPVHTLILAALAAASFSVHAEDPRPNILFCIADDASLPHFRSCTPIDMRFADWCWL